MYMGQSLESFENWRDSQYDHPEPDTEAPEETMPAEDGHDTKHPVVFGPIDAEKRTGCIPGAKQRMPSADALGICGVTSAAPATSFLRAGLTTCHS